MSKKEKQIFKREDKIIFNNDVVIYVPIYKCADQSIQLINKISKKIISKASFLLIDNNSSDNTLDTLVKWIGNCNIHSNITIISTDKNIGYHGSQKLAYTIILESNLLKQNLKKIIMLHGDGQYSSELLDKFEDYIDSDYSIVYGYRSKKIHKEKEETPFTTYFFIKLLNRIESFITGIKCDEWHSGFVMYDINFIEKINLNRLTNTNHIDGNIQYIAGKLNLNKKSLPIYKKYKNHNQFAGIQRLKYVMNVLFLMFKFRFYSVEKYMKNNEEQYLESSYKLILKNY